MAAPALLLVSPNVPEDPTFLARLTEALVKRRPGVMIGATDQGMVTMVHFERMADAHEVVCVPLQATSTSPSVDLTRIKAWFAEHRPDILLTTADGLGANGPLFAALDRHLHEALAKVRASEIDALVLAHDGDLDDHEQAILNRRSRVWSQRHRLPVRLASADARSTSQQLRSLADMGKRHIGVAVLSLLPTDLDALSRLPQVAAVADSLGEDEAVLDELLSSYEVAAVRSLLLA